MLRKKYISLGANPLSVDVFDDNGMLHTFDFRGGLKHPVVKPCFYYTTDEKEQQLLESYAGYGVSFALEGSAEKADVIEPMKPIAAVVADKTEATTEKTFKNVQEAKDWLNDTYKVPFSQLTNKQKVVDEALKVGFILSFETDNK